MPMTRPEFASIAAGAFVMGAPDGPHPEDGEGPARSISLAAFDIAKTAVSVAEFAEFVQASGHVTRAEANGGSHVFQGQLRDPATHAVISSTAPWWRWVDGAAWHTPCGHNPAGPEDPVVQVSRDDALAFCDWSNTRLPTEAEWERAAGSQAGITPHIWQGEFPDAPLTPPRPRRVTEADPNEFGLYHACGNVWEWTADRFARLHSPRPDTNPKGPLSGSRFVVKGGSFLCAPSYCARFRPTSRRGETAQATTGHLGFRVVR